MFKALRTTIYLKLGFNHAVAAVILALCLAAPVQAGQFEDGLAAFYRGDYATALQVLRPMAEQGNSGAQVAIGQIYFEGDGVPQSDAEAAKWFRLAAEQGVVFAQSVLGFMYQSGRGLPQNNVEAVKWLRLAAEQGIADSQWRLGNMYERGEGVPQDYILAHMWFNLSAARGDQIAAYSRDQIAKRMPAEQITEAQKLAREWKPKQSPSISSWVK
jgi:uncharacterized protein